MSASIHPSAVVETERVGEDCVVHEHASVSPGVTLEGGVEVGAGARLLGDVAIAAGGSIGPNAVLGRPEATGNGVLRIGRGVRIGSNASVSAGVAIGRGAVVEAGSAVETDVPAYAIVRGSPARIVGYVDSLPEPTEPELLDLDAVQEPTATSVPGVVLHPLTHARDLRGSLAAAEFRDLPFEPRRVFAVYDVPSESVRGAHAHRRCGQLLVCTSGEVNCIADDGTARQELRLSSPRVALHIPPLVWSMQYRYTRDACLVVLAELPYDPDDYVRDYEEFLELVGVPAP